MREVAYRAAMRLALPPMILIAAARLGYETWRLVGMAGLPGAIDLLALHRAVHDWCAGVPTIRAGYPPASYAILWLPLGWLDAWEARWLWAIGVYAALVCFGGILVERAGAVTRLERAFWALLLLSTASTAITIGNGQLAIHVVLALIVGLTLLHPGRGVTWRNDVIGAALVVVALVKLSITIPFLWLVLFVPGRWRPVVLALAGYAVLTVGMAALEPVPLRILLDESLRGGASLIDVPTGAAHLGIWMAALGWTRWIPLASVAALAALGAWLYRHRDRELWLLLGVCGIVARVWTYHNMYDDLLILLPMVVLYRIATRDDPTTTSPTIAGVLFAAAWLGLEMPGTLARLSFPWDLPYEIWQTSTWLAILAFLATYARRPVANQPYRHGAGSSDARAARSAYTAMSRSRPFRTI